jgi:hypothetical protein
VRCRCYVWQALGIEGNVEAKCPGCQQWTVFVSGEALAAPGDCAGGEDAAPADGKAA